MRFTLPICTLYQFTLFNRVKRMLKTFTLLLFEFKGKYTFCRSRRVKRQSIAARRALTWSANQERAMTSSSRTISTIICIQTTIICSSSILYFKTRIPAMIRTVRRVSTWQMQQLLTPSSHYSFNQELIFHLHRVTKIRWSRSLEGMAGFVLKIHHEIPGLSQVSRVFQ